MGKHTHIGGKLGLLTLLVFGVSACSQAPNQKQIVKVAPNAQDQTGLVVEGVSLNQITPLLHSRAEAKVRVVSEDHNILEVHGIDATTVKSHFPKAYVSPNVYREMQLTEPKKSTRQIFNEEAANTSSIVPCVTNEEAPKISVNFSQQAPETWRNFTIDLGDELSLSLAQSSPHPNHPGPLTKAWIVVPPMGSALEPQVIEGEAITLRPDALGAYTFEMLVQDSRGVCAFGQMPIMVTVNEELQEPANTLERVRSVDTSSFWHLDSLQTQEAWQFSTGQNVKIAVLDTGVNYNHPLLTHNIHSTGYDFVNSDRYAYDDNRHGSHVAGLAASPLFGQAKDAEILPVKVLNAAGGGDDATVAAGIRYAVDQGSDIINISLGGSHQPNPTLLRAVSYAEANNVLVVVAVGNGDPVTKQGFDISITPVYPAALSNRNILTVAATADGQEMAPYSNFGSHFTDVVAPGGNNPEIGMLSTVHELPDGHAMAALSGTSMATPVVSGVAALVKAIQPGLSPAAIRNLLMRAGQKDAFLEGLIQSERHMNALDAVRLASSAPAVSSALAAVQ